MIKNIFLAVLMIITLNVEAGVAAESVISVQGVAERALEPNIVSFTIEVWSKALTAKEAQTKAASQFKFVKKSFEDFKIKKEDIQSLNYSLNPETEYDPKTRQNKLTGFRVSQLLVVSLRKVDDAGSFLDSIVMDKKSLDSGVNLNGILWDSDKKAEVEISVLGDAVRAARQRADEIAKAAGVKISGVSKISHTSASVGPQPMYRSLAFGAVAEKANATELASGEVKVRVEVFADYLIK